MKNLAILSGALVAGLLAFSPASAGGSMGTSAMFYADAGAPQITKAHYRHRRWRRRFNRHRRYYGNYYYGRPYYNRYYYNNYRGWGYGGHRRRGNFGVYFNF